MRTDKALPALPDEQREMNYVRALYRSAHARLMRAINATRIMSAHARTS